MCIDIFSGVSCDSCLKNNFRGRRYKCLICIDYDLCAACYESGATTNQHTTEHPMQCILSRSDFGETYLQFYIYLLEYCLYAKHFTKNPFKVENVRVKLETDKNLNIYHIQCDIHRSGYCISIFFILMNELKLM